MLITLTSKVYDELSRSRDLVRELQRQLRQLQDEVSSLRAHRPQSSLERIRAVYGGGGAPTGRPLSSSSRGCVARGWKGQARY